MSQPLQIAIDGPVAAGKGDIAARLARDLGIIYIYTGAMYRALALSCLRAGVAAKDAPGVLSVLNNSDINLVQPDAGSDIPYKVLLNGEDVTHKIFDQEVAMGASDVSTHSEVRKILVSRQQEIAKGKRVVMEGRDIGLRVLPQAQLKIYLTASIAERAKRRFTQRQQKGITGSFEEVLTDTHKRDIQDTTRVHDPLQKLPDAWELDTTNLTQDEVVVKIKDELRQRKLL